MSTGVENQNNVTNNDGDKVLDLRSLFRTLRLHTTFIVVVTIFFVILGGVYAHTRPAIYQSKSFIQVESSSSNASNIMALLRVGGNGGSNFTKKASPASIETSLLRSRYIMGDVVEEMGLNINAHAHYFPIIYNTKVLINPISPPNTPPQTTSQPRCFLIIF